MVARCGNPGGCGSRRAVGVRDSFQDPTTRVARFDVFPEFAQLAAYDKFTVPITGTFPSKICHTAMEINLSGHARGKLPLLPQSLTAG